MTRGNKPRIQYNPVFRDSSSNHPFEDIFLYDNDTSIYYNNRQTINGDNIKQDYENDNEKDNEKDNTGCFYSFNKIIIKIVGYFIDSK